MGQTTSAEHAEPEVEADVDSAHQETTGEKEIKESSEEESREEQKQIKGEVRNAPIPTKGESKREKKATRSSLRVAKKLNSLGSNVMITKIEQQSSAGESLLCVYEIEAPQIEPRKLKKEV